MGLLEERMSRRAKAVMPKGAKLPKYGKNGKPQSVPRMIMTGLGGLLIILSVCVVALHIPTLTYKAPEETNEFIIKPDEAGIRSAIQFAKDNPAGDFDFDGLTNADEATYGTDARNPDTDMDGISDYAEIHITGTRPNVPENALLNLTKERLDAAGLQVNSPYKVHDVVLWADSLAARSRGTVVPTMRGYRIWDFRGWAQFPIQGYAYQLVDGYHRLLQYREAEKAWRVDSNDEIVFYEQPLEEIYLVNLFGTQYYMEDTVISRVLNAVVPHDHSFITLKKVALQDTWETTISATVTEKKMPDGVDRDSLLRFGENTVLLPTLNEVYSSIKKGRPVLMSLQSHKYGESFAIVYGFTDYGDLMLCDTEKFEDIGLLDIVERAAIMYDKDKNIMQREWFSFKGIGFDSRVGDKIHFMLPSNK